MISTPVSAMRPKRPQALSVSASTKRLLRIANTTSAKVIESIVPPTVMFAAAFFCTP
jgi:hypothetical protein